MHYTEKTYYGLGVAASALTVAGSAAYFLGIYTALLFNIATLLTALMMLMLLLERGAGDARGRALAAALVLALCQLAPGIFSRLGGALAWPVFALPVWRQTREGEPLHSAAFLVMVAGAVQLVGSFLPLPAMFKAALAVAIAACQLALSVLLFRAKGE